MSLKNLNKAGARRMIGDLRTGQTLFWIGVALIIHLVLIGATSTGYIRDRWIDPAGAEARRQAAAAEAQKAATAPAATQPQPIPATKPVVADNDAATEKRMLEQRKNSKVVRDITEPAKPNEIPKEPTRNGFDLDEQLSN